MAKWCLSAKTSVCEHFGGIFITDDDKIMQNHYTKNRTLLNFSKSTLCKRKFDTSTSYIRANLFRKLHIKRERRHFMENFHILLRDCTMRCMYADDTEIYAFAKNFDELVNIINCNLENIRKWM